MLPKKERLSRQAFNRFFSLGRRSHSPSVQVVYTKHPTLHVSVVVPKKVAAKAVRRNKIRRRIYDMVRRHRSEVDTKGVFIIVAKPEAAARTYAELREELHGHLSRIAV